MSTQLSQRMARKMDEAHRLLGQRIGSVRDLVDGVWEWDELARELAALRSELEQHFVLEETEVYMKVEGMDPVQWERIRALTDEHRTLLDELAAIQKDAKASAHVVRAALESFLRKVAQHERVETQVVAEAYDRAAMPRR